ncbi:MAG: hypothetical protein H0U85_09195, partial [Gemmatimonadales bacterium]|nr:hypothetical protein [Gemmatimonadales bacterium]
MGKRRWTVVLVPHGSEPSRIVEVSYTVLKLAAGACVAVVLISLLLGYASVSRSVDISRAVKLEQENAALAAQIGELHGRMGSLSDTLQLIAQRDQQIRVLANLNPIDPQVRAAGI